LTEDGHRARDEAGVLGVGIALVRVAADVRVAAIPVGGTQVADIFTALVRGRIAFVAAIPAGIDAGPPARLSGLDTQPWARLHFRERGRGVLLPSQSLARDPGSDAADDTLEHGAPRRARTDELGQPVEPAIVHRRLPLVHPGPAAWQGASSERRLCQFVTTSC